MNIYLANLSLAKIITFWRPGSGDWSWAEEYDLLIDDPRTKEIEKRVLDEGFGFIDYISPILLGSDGRVWDGHHRIILAIKHEVPNLSVETVENTNKPQFQDLGGGAYRVTGVRVNPITGQYITRGKN